MDADTLDRDEDLVLRLKQAMKSEFNRLAERNTAEINAQSDASIRALWAPFHEQVVAGSVTGWDQLVKEWELVREKFRTEAPAGCKVQQVVRRFGAETVLLDGGVLAKAATEAAGGGESVKATRRSGKAHKARKAAKADKQAKDADKK